MADAVMGYFVAGCLLGCLLIVLGEEAIDAARVVRREWREWRREVDRVSDNRSGAGATE